MSKYYFIVLALIMNLLIFNAVLGGEPASVQGTKYVDNSTINAITLEQLSSFLKLVNLNKSNWPTIMNSASNLFVKNAKLPPGYQELLKNFKTREDAQYIDYTLYNMRERGRHGRDYKVWIRVVKETGLLWKEVGGIPQMPIYDSLKITKATNKASEETSIIVVNSLEPIGQVKHSSILKSAASVTKCEPTWTAIVDSTLKNNYAPTGDDNDEENSVEAARWHISKVNEAIPITCATVDYGKFSIAIMYFLLNAENTDKQITGNKLLWISKYDRKTLKLTETVYSGISNESIYDIVNDLHVKAIADTNNDGYHDIVLTDARYAGESYIVLQFEESGDFKIINIQGMGWD